MDEIVLKSMLKWPDVPAVFGWIRLDRRGHWLIKGQRVSNPIMRDFMGRNYHFDDRGRWYVQNGPQRVFVTLDYAPYVLSTTGSGEPHRLVTHTGAELEEVTGAWIDEQGILILRWSGGAVGSVCDRDLNEVVNWLTDAAGRATSDESVTNALDDNAGRGSSGIWLSYGSQRLPIGHVQSSRVPQKFGFDPSPQPEPGQPDC